MYLVSHPVGNQNVRQLLKALEENGKLHTYVTSISHKKKTLLGCLIPKVIEEQLSRRSYQELNNNCIVTYPLFDITRLALKKLNIDFFTDNSSGIFRPEMLYKYIDSKSSNYLRSNQRTINTIYGYDSKSLATFKTAKDLKLKTVYEAAFGYTPHIANLLKEEAQLKPEWVESIPKISTENIERQIQEVKLADKIIVASNFAKSSFEKEGVNKDISVIPYGAPPIKPNLNNALNEEQPLKIIYIGALTQQKGISYLFDAVNTINSNKYDLTIIGSDYSNGRNITLKEQLKPHRWIPSESHQNVLNILSRSDILILPSIAEAFGLVVLEAFSRGVTVIVSENCGASDLVADNFNGYVTPIRNAKAISDKILMLSNNRVLLEQLKSHALETASKNSWENYREKINCNIL